jgi:hypothetical protein
MEGCYSWQVLNVENYHANIAVSGRGSWFMSCCDGLVFADSTGLVLFLRRKGTLAKMRAFMPLKNTDGKNNLCTGKNNCSGK